jgi:hypothetical protein
MPEARISAKVIFCRVRSGMSYGSANKPFGQARAHAPVNAYGTKLGNR